MSQKMWKNYGGSFFLEHPNVDEKEILENKVYVVKFDQNRGAFYLEYQQDEFKFPYKIYNMNDDLIQRVTKTYNSISNNLGILFNGIKGTGKTVTAKNICNSLGLPVIIVSFNMPGIIDFLSSIPQDVTIFIDEYEKIFGEKQDLLTLMDGVFSNYENSRRAFILTTNNLYINDNLLQRPGRIRYLKTFEDIEPEVIEEILDDMLLYPEFREETLAFISSLQTITVDISKSIIEEVNIHRCSPSEFENIFNVKKNTSKFDISFKTNRGFVKLLKGIMIEPFGLIDSNGNNYESYNLYLNSVYFGEISDRIHKNVYKIKYKSDPYDKNDFGKLSKDEIKSLIQDKLGEIVDNRFENIILDDDFNYIIKIEKSETLHFNYKYNTYADLLV